MVFRKSWKYATKVERGNWTIGRQKSIKRRVHLKGERTKDSQRRKKWSAKHGHDTYGGDTEDLDSEAKPKHSKQAKQKGKSSGNVCRCGSTSHSRTSHRDCPLNMKNLPKSAVPPAAVRRKRDVSTDEDTEEALYSHGLSSDDSAGESSYRECYDSDESVRYSSWSDDDVVQCTCGAEGRAHKRGCPMNSRQYFCGATSSDSTAKVPVKRGLWAATADTSKPPFKKRRGSLKFQPGDHVCIHASSVLHVTCPVVLSKFSASSTGCAAMQVCSAHVSAVVI